MISLLLPIVILGFAILISLLLKKKNNTSIVWLRLISINLTWEVLLTLFSFVLVKFTNANLDNCFSILAILIVSVILNSYLLADSFYPKYEKLLKKILVSVVALFILETTLFNYQSYAFKKYQKVIDPSSVRFEDEYSDSYEINEDGLFILKDTSFFIDNPSAEITDIVLNLGRYNYEIYPTAEVLLIIRDGNLNYSDICVGYKKTTANNVGVHFTIDPHEVIHHIRIDMAGVNVPIKLGDIELSNYKDYAFNTCRFMLLSSLFIVLILIKDFKLYKTIYDSKKTTHKLVLSLSILFSLIVTSLFFPNSNYLVDYPLKEDPSQYDLYVSLTDAFIKGQTSLDTEFGADVIESLDDRFDASEREEKGVAGDVIWDAAYYDGHYYCYFGVVPVVLFNMPVYLLTGKIPTVRLINMFFGILATIFISLSSVEILKYWVKKINLLLLLLSIPAAVAVGCVYHSVNQNFIYYSAILSALTFLSASVYLGYKAMNSSVSRNRIILLILSGISLALCAGSRPTTAVGAAVMLPGFFAILLDKKKLPKKRISEALAFLVPLFVVLIPIFAYNYVRFGSLMQFGSDYQITGTNMNAQAIRLSLFANAIFSYFFQLPSNTNYFPFFDMRFYRTYNHEMYKCISANVGLIYVPLILIGVLLFFRYLLNRNKKTNIEFFSYNLVCFLGATIVSWVIYCIAGSMYRYNADFVLLLLWGSLPLIFRYIEGNKKKFTYIVLGISFVVSFVFLTTLAAEIPLTNFENINYSIIENLEHMIVFWH